MVDILKCGREEGRAGQPRSVSFSGMLLPVNLSLVEHRVHACTHVHTYLPRPNACATQYMAVRIWALNSISGVL